MKLGFHVSISGSIDKAVDRANDNNCTTFQIFSRNPRSWSSKSLNQLEVELFKKKLEESKISPVYLHMPYIFNLSSPEKETYIKSKKTLKEEIFRCKLLQIPYIVMHMGSSLGKNRNNSLKRLIDGIREILNDEIPGILLENNSGTKNGIGSKFEDIKFILDSINDYRIGVCLDTCHAFAAGYDFRNNMTEIIERIKQNLGLDRLKLIHLNDSFGDLASGVDKHEHICLGKIGTIGFLNILQSKLIESPLIMETPIDDRRNNKDNMLMVKKLADL